MENEGLDQLENFEMVAYRISAEGFHYCFENYSSFEEITDDKFHQLRLAYLAAAADLEKYINDKIEELQNESDGN